MNAQKVGVLMANGKDERHNSNRKVSKEAKAMTTFDMGGGATVQRMLSPELQKDLEKTKSDESDAESAYKVAMDNDGVDAPREFDKNTDGW